MIRRLRCARHDQLEAVPWFAWVRSGPARAFILLITAINVVRASAEIIAVLSAGSLNEIAVRTGHGNGIGAFEMTIGIAEVNRRLRTRIATGPTKQWLIVTPSTLPASLKVAPSSCTITSVDTHMSRCGSCTHR
jgi:hypothetical protein